MNTIHYANDMGLKRRLRELKNQTLNEKSEKGDYRLYLKTAIGYLAWIFVFRQMVFVEHSTMVTYVWYAIMGTILPFIGFTTMHDACHGAYSKKAWVNTLLGYSLEFTGAFSTLWKIKHNQKHHSRVNIKDEDEDINPGPFMRFDPHQKWRWIHQFQHILGPLLFYPSLYISWLFQNDFQKYFTRKLGNTSLNFSKRDHFVFWISKISYVFVFFVIPCTQIGWTAILGFVIMSAVCGQILSHVFQPAHVTTVNKFIEPNENGYIPVSEPELQAVSTSDFATKNWFVTWYTGGLNFQVIHHLLPGVSHVHYPILQEPVKNLLKEYNIPYNEFPTFLGAEKDHYKHLKNMGKKPELSAT